MELRRALQPVDPHGARLAALIGGLAREATLSSDRADDEEPTIRRRVVVAALQRLVRDPQRWDSGVGAIVRDMWELLDPDRTNRLDVAELSLAFGLAPHGDMESPKGSPRSPREAYRLPGGRLIEQLLRGYDSRYHGADEPRHARLAPSPPAGLNVAALEEEARRAAGLPPKRSPLQQVRLPQDNPPAPPQSGGLLATLAPAAGNPVTPVNPSAAAAGGAERERRSHLSSFTSSRIRAAPGSATARPTPHRAAPGLVPQYDGMADPGTPLVWGQRWERLADQPARSRSARLHAPSPRGAGRPSSARPAPRPAPSPRPAPRTCALPRRTPVTSTSTASSSPRSVGDKRRWRPSPTLIGSTAWAEKRSGAMAAAFAAVRPPPPRPAAAPPKPRDTSSPRGRPTSADRSRSPLPAGLRWSRSPLPAGLNH